MLNVFLGHREIFHVLRKILTLAVNDLANDESMSRDGNCGISAFTISLLALAQLKGDRERATSAEARRRQALRRCPHGQRVMLQQSNGWGHA